MFKIPKQEYTAEFKELAVKRVKAGQGLEILHWDQFLALAARS